MKNITAIALYAGLAITLTGCGNHKLGDVDLFGKGGSWRNYGEVSKDRLFAVSRKVLLQYYTIDSADPSAGTITTHPVQVDEDKFIIKRSSARQYASLSVVSEGDSSTVGIDVIQERQFSRAQTSFVNSQSNYSGNPGRESTIESGRMYWTREKSRRDIENQILADIAEELATKRIGK